MTALRNASKCSFTISKFRFFVIARLVLPSLATFFGSLPRALQEGFAQPPLFMDNARP
jgi:hypothetical protein